MAPLNVAELRSLARMFRQGVDGAREQLELLAHERGEELTAVLGFPRANLDPVLDTGDLATLVAATIEGSVRLKREGVTRSRRETARALAATLSDASEHRDDGSAALHGALAEIVALWGSGWIVFGALGSVEAARLRAILRHCRGVTSRSIILTRESLFVFYETACSRGVIRLHLQRVVFHADALHIPIDIVGDVAPVEPAPPAPDPKPIDTTDPIPALVERARPAPRPHRSFARHLVEAALTFALGGQP
ncbi:MAG: hypothetical protein AB7S26_30720 [Sandaracinaceae bacterium]